MPCGGIEPIRPRGRGTIKEHLPPTEGGCWVCNRGGCHHFCLEWDTYIHARCVPTFLQTEEGQIVVLHQHRVVLDFELEEEYAKNKSSQQNQETPPR
jgi:hypothetical protein